MLQVNGANEKRFALEPEQESAIAALVHNGFVADQGWSIERTPEWIIVSSIGSTLPEQGWKLHVSAGPAQAEEVLRRVIPLLQEERVCFKVAPTQGRIRALNHGFAGSSQVGKFLTIYPCNAQQAVRLGLQLDERTRGLRGPAVPSDRPVRPGSLVFYRYGSFVSRLMYTVAGKVVPVLKTPSGELVADTRQGQVLDWARDPFIATRESETHASQQQTAQTLLAKRYFPLFMLVQSARGGVLLGVDIRDGRSCICKFARKNAYLDGENRDACDLLRYEARMLQRLAGDTAFPDFFDLFEQDDCLYLVMEEIEGETLEKCAERLFAQGELPVAQVVAWGRALADIFARMHAQGLVYRDLKPTNVMVQATQHLRLIDFELMVEQGSLHRKRDIGTRGFMSPQHRAGEAASYADDIYSLGALLYYLLTRANPSLAPDPGNLLQRPVRVLNPWLDAKLAQVIERCLAADPASRFPSMRELEAALARLELHDFPALVEQTIPASPEHYLDLARRLGDTLCQNTHRQPQRPGVCWLSRVQFPDGRALRALNTGCSGTVLALAELVACQDNARYRATLYEGAQWLVSSEDVIANPVPGLYVGEAGVAAALLRAGQVLGDATLIEVAAKKSHWIARQPYTCQDMMSGAAGRLRLHLLLWDHTHDAEHLQAAIAAGDWLLSVAQDAGDGGICWTLPADFTGMTYVGYAHGAAGIADALLDLFEVSGEARFLLPVQGVCRLLQKLAVPVLHDRSGLNWPLYVHDQKREMAGVYWCHGATGVGTFLLHAHQLDLVPLELAARAARTVAYGARWAGPTLCHGLAGNIEFLLDMYQHTGDQEYVRQATTLASLLETFAVEQERQLVWPSDMPTCISPDYLLGYAGIMVTLLRLASADQQPRQLSRRGFFCTGRSI